MIWKCNDAKLLWAEICAMLSDVFTVKVPCPPMALLLNDASSSKLTTLNRRILLRGITVAKNLLAMCWKPPHRVTKAHWMNTYADLVSTEASLAKMRRAKAETISSL